MKVVQASAGVSPGKKQVSMVNFFANEATLFSMSPSGVVKSSCWFHVIVPHRPRTYNTFNKNVTYSLFQLFINCHHHLDFFFKTRKSHYLDLKKFRFNSIPSISGENL